MKTNLHISGKITSQQFILWLIIFEDKFPPLIFFRFCKTAVFFVHSSAVLMASTLSLIFLGIFFKECNWLKSQPILLRTLNNLFFRSWAWKVKGVVNAIVMKICMGMYENEIKTKYQWVDTVIRRFFPFHLERIVNVE